METKVVGSGWMWSVRILCLVWAAFIIANQVGLTRPQLGVLGAHYDGVAGFSYDHPAQNGFITIRSVEPGSAMAQAGVVAGDQVRFSHFYDAIRLRRTGERVDFALIHEGHKSYHQVAAKTPRLLAPTGLALSFRLLGVAGIVATVIGTFVVWRARRNATSLMLGGALVASGLGAFFPELMWPPEIFPFAVALNFATIAATSILFYAFARRFYRDCVGPPTSFETPVFWTYVTLLSLALGVIFVCLTFLVSFPIIGDGLILQPIGSCLGLFACLGYLVLGWRKSEASVRRRYALLLLAISAILASQLIANLYFSTLPDAVKTANLLAEAALSGVIAPGLFAYAIQRDKVLDLGFAVNRTLVYGVISALILGAFGLIEWAADHVIPIQGREKNALVDAAIAVGVFLTFHRVRDVVERGVEGLFFRRWQQAEAALRRFVREAAFVTEAQALSEAFVVALGHFSDGAQAAVYILDGRGYRRVAGEVEGAPAELDANTPALVRLRAELKPREADEQVLAGCLIAPMVYRNEVIGIALLGAKPANAGYRPDEIELVGWATHQVGLDLHALKVEQLQASEADLHTTVAMLQTQVATLRSVIPQSA